MEIERKFLVAELPLHLSEAESALITQIYLTECGSDCEKRIRKVVRGGRDAHFLTEKSGNGLMRSETETRISRAEFDSLSRVAVSDAIIKKRHFVPIGGELTAELDIYEGNLSGLITVEVEFASTNEAIAFAPPPWFGCEITDDKRYKNRSLAENGIPK